MNRLLVQKIDAKKFRAECQASPVKPDNFPFLAMSS